MDFFSVSEYSAVNVFFLPYDFLNNILFSLAYFIVNTVYDTYNIQSVH